MRKRCWSHLRRRRIRGRARSWCTISPILAENSNAVRSLVILGGVLLAIAGPAFSSIKGDDPLVSLSFERARLPTVIGALARQSGRNFIIAPEVGTIADVTIELSNVPFSSALALLSQTYSFCVVQQREDIVSLKSCAPDASLVPGRLGGVQFVPPPGGRHRPGDT